MVSTITPAIANQDLLEIVARLVRLSFFINYLYYLIDSFFGSFFDFFLFVSPFHGCRIGAQTGYFGLKSIFT